MNCQVSQPPHNETSNHSHCADIHQRRENARGAIGTKSCSNIRIRIRERTRRHEYKSDTYKSVTKINASAMKPINEI